MKWINKKFIKSAINVMDLILSITVFVFYFGKDILEFNFIKL